MLRVTQTREQPDAHLCHLCVSDRNKISLVPASPSRTEGPNDGAHLPLSPAAALSLEELLN